VPLRVPPLENRVRNQHAPPYHRTCIAVAGTTTAASLSKEFAGKVAAEDVDRCLPEALELLSQARVREFIPILAERKTRTRLWALVQQR
jgi:hypothetical protein